jgi:hypothetical protein
MLGAREAAHHFEINLAVTDGLMVAALGAHFVQMKAQHTWCHFFEHATFIEQAHGLLDVSVTGVVPIAGRGIRRETVNEFLVVGVVRESVESLPVLKRELHTFFLRVTHHLGHTLLGAFAKVPIRLRTLTRL